MQDDLATIARAIVDANRYLTLATADAQGVPWVTPVWFAHAGYRELLWVSDPEARHSQNLAARAEVAIVIFDSQAPVGSGQGVYVTATAEQLDDPERGIETFSRRSLEQGLSEWTLDDVRAPARHRLYRATASEHYLGDRSDHRIPVSITARA